MDSEAVWNRCSEVSYSRVAWCVSVEGNGCRGGLGSTKILRFCLFFCFSVWSLESLSKGPLPWFRLGWLPLSNTVWMITVIKHHAARPVWPEHENNLNAPAEDKSLRSGANKCGVWQLSSGAELLFCSGSGGSTSLFSNGKGETVSSLWSDDDNDDDLLVSKVAIWESADAALSFVNVLLTSSLSLEFCKETEASTGSSSCESVVFMSFDGELLEWVSRNETLFILPCLLVSSKSSPMTFVLLFRAWNALAFSCLDFRKLKKSEKNMVIWLNM